MADKAVQRRNILKSTLAAAAAVSAAAPLASHAQATVTWRMQALWDGGTTPQKFEEHRLTMASNEWARMKANNSQECRNCHNFEYMDFTAQKTVAAKMHDKAITEGKTCIDCHKGIAHKLPDMHGVPTGF